MSNSSHDSMSTGRLVALFCTNRLNQGTFSDREDFSDMNRFLGATNLPLDSHAC